MIGMSEREGVRVGWCKCPAALILLICLFAAPASYGAEIDKAQAVNSATIGCILPLSGRYAALGNQALDAVLLAADVFNAAKETPIRILIEDSQSDAHLAGAAVAKLADGGVIGILGPLASQEALEAAGEAQRLKVPILTLTQREGITGTGEFVFRNFLTAAMQVRTVVQYAQAQLGLRRFAVLYPQDPYGQEMARLFREEVLRKGGEIRKAQPYRIDQTDIGEEIRALVGMTPEAYDAGSTAVTPPPKTKPDFEALFIPDAAFRVAMIVPQLAYHDVSGVQLLGTSGWDSPALFKTDPDHLQGAVFVDAFFVESFRPEVNNFVDAFYTAYGREPDAMEALVYDSAAIAVRLLLESRAETRESFREGLLQVKGYQGVTGRTSFPPSRDAQKELFILTVKDGQIIQVQ